MGNYVNKFFPHNNETVKDETKKQDEGIVDENMQTPKVVHKTLPIDPRSVTTGINRTPIEVNSTPVGLNKRMVSAIPRHLQRKPYLETDIDKVIQCLTPKTPSTPNIIETIKPLVSDMENKDEGILLTPVNAANDRKLKTKLPKDRYNILRLDPRSPAADFDRTPILMPKSVDSLKTRSQENLTRHDNYNADVLYPRFSYCETSSQFTIPEIQALPDLAMYEMKPLNLDFRSDDFSCSTHSSSSEISYDSVIDEQAESREKIETPLKEKNYKNVQKVLHVNDTDIIKVWRDSLVLGRSKELKSAESDNVQVMQEKIAKVQKEEVIITFDDDSVAKDTLSFKLSKHENNKNIAETREENRTKRKALKGQLKNTLDENKVLNSNDKNVNESSKIRTPLGNRSNNGQMQTFSKSPQQIFRGKGIASKMLQENTPPHKKYTTKSKLNGIQWDPDSTVVI